MCTDEVDQDYLKSLSVVTIVNKTKFNLPTDCTINEQIKAVTYTYGPNYNLRKKTGFKAGFMNNGCRIINKL